MMREVIAIVAAALDWPSVFMGGPSKQSTASAERVIRRLDKAGFVIVPKEPTEMDSEDET